jgi:biopolymer transport protein ExbD
MATRRSRRRFQLHGAGIALDLTPMIDIVFLLLVFFAITAVFLEVERRFDAALPTDRGIADAAAIPLAEIALFLEWLEGPGGDRCVLRTADYDAGDGSGRPLHEFATVAPGAPAEVGPGTAPDLRQRRVEYPHPDFAEAREYLARRRRSFQALGYDLPVTVHFGAHVPVQMVVSTLDACKEAGIRDCGVAVAEVD